MEAVSYAPGVLTTHRFRQESGGTIGVNVDASAGELRYEVLEDTGDPIPGFTAAECDPIRTDTVNGELSWNGVPRVAQFERRAAGTVSRLAEGGVLHQVAVLHFSGYQTVLADAGSARGHRMGRQGQGKD